MALLAKIVVEKTTYAFDKPFTYLVPNTMAEAVKPGCRVLVPFGNGNRKRQGLVLELENQPVTQQLKEVTTLVDSEPVLNEEQLKMLEYLRTSTFCTYYDALKVLIPSGIGLKVDLLCTLNPMKIPEEVTDDAEIIVHYLEKKKKAVPLAILQKDLGITAANLDMAYLVREEIVTITEDVHQKVGDLTVQMARLMPEYLTGELPMPKLTSRQKSVVDLLMETGCASVKEIGYFCGITSAVVHTLQKKGIVELYGRPVLRNPYEGVPEMPNPEKAWLSEEQQCAYEELKKELLENPGETSLLYGVTGSGKTQVFLKLIHHVIEQGRQVIVLVPEISLTPQTVEIFQNQFGKQVAVLHSGLTMGERSDEYKRIREGKAQVVIGTRSAVFAPLQNIGLIVMDEEQEHSYQSEQTPKFHARDVAKWRCRYHKAMLLLASATPSVESFYYAQKGKYHLVKLKERYSGQQLPEVSIVDMSDQYGAVLSTQLISEMQRNLQNHQQTILLMNRRGYHTIVKCSQCGEPVTCPHCSVTMTYHASNGRMMCHYCGYSQSLPDACPACGSKMIRYAGAGTQKVEEELNRIFPEAAVLRMDMDTTLSRFAHEKKFSAFARGEYDIMVGTQMVAKGHNFPNVTLVGVLNADQSLYAQDFRCYENTFSLLTQVVGRCGRGALPGRAYIQTTDPNHYVLAQAAGQDYDRFFEDEIAGRRLGLYPPFCDMCLVGFVSEDQKRVRQAALRFGALFAELASREYAGIPMRLLEPCEPSIEKIAGKHRYRLLVKCRRSKQFSELMWRTLCAFDSDHQNKGVFVSVDMNYNGTM